jgi:hypothetical protein
MSSEKICISYLIPLFPFMVMIWLGKGRGLEFGNTRGHEVRNTSLEKGEELS